MTTTDPVAISDVDLLDLDAFVEGRHHAMFATLREQDPVHFHAEPDGPGFWAVTKHHDLQAVNRDTATFSSQLGGTQRVDPDPEEFDTRGVLLLDSDPPQHTRYRRLVNKGFTPRMIGLLEQHLRYRAELIVDSVIEHGSCEFVSDLAAELPLQAIAEIMGVPQEDRRLLFDWSNAMIGAQDPEYQDPDNPDRPLQAAGEIFAYANDLATQRRDDPRDDIVTTLINAEIEGEKLSELEFDMFMLLLTVAGNETTRNATSAGMHALLTHPDEMSRFRAPSTTTRTVVACFDEVLRRATAPHSDAPQRSTPRSASGDRGGRQGAHLARLAKRDEEVFDDPFRFTWNAGPTSTSPGGGGAHYAQRTPARARHHLRRGAQPHAGPVRRTGRDAAVELRRSSTCRSASPRSTQARLTGRVSG